jgi:hypothetical protein
MQRIFIKSLLTDLKVNFDTKANVIQVLVDICETLKHPLS